jgi:hypothetical protein
MNMRVYTVTIPVTDDELNYAKAWELVSNRLHKASVLALREGVPEAGEVNHMDDMWIGCVEL